MKITIDGVSHALRAPAALDAELTEATGCDAAETRTALRGTPLAGRLAAALRPFLVKDVAVQTLAASIAADDSAYALIRGLYDAQHEHTAVTAPEWTEETRELNAIEKNREAEKKREQERRAAASRAESDARRGVVTPGKVGGLLKDQFGGTVVARQLLALEQEQVRAALEKTRDTSQDPREVQRAIAALGQRPAIEQGQRDTLERDQEGPLDSYRRGLKQATGDMKESLEEVAVRGFGALEDAATREIATVFKLKGAYGDLAASILADLARIAIQKAIVAAIDLFGGGKDKGGEGEDSGFTFSGIAASLGATLAALKIKGFANGGNPPMGVASLVGERGPELFVPRVPGTVVANGKFTMGRSEPAVVQISVGPGEMFEPMVRAISGNVAVEVVGRGAAGLARQQQQSLAQ